MPLNAAFTEKRTVVLDQPVLLGRLIEGTEAPTNSLKFNSKVVSRAHARIVPKDGKVFVQDTKSSSGTFLNASRLSERGEESQLIEVKDGDVLKLGEDFNQNGVIHQCILMKVLFGAGRSIDEQSPQHKGVDEDERENSYV